MAASPGRPAALDPELLFADYAAAGGVLVAVSGGPDSMALLRLAAEWARHPGRPPLHAATVDHGLRAPSRGEAERVGGRAAALGVDHHILTWTGDKPSTRIQERARAARYALLEAHAAELGLDTLWTAHHADDQVETILFRLGRGSGIGGLAGMAARRQRGPLLHGRPLLGLRKAALVEFCTAQGQDFIVDPSNDDPRFARTRLRRLARLLETEGLGSDEVLRLGERARRAEAALAAAADKAAASVQAGGFRVAAAELALWPDEIVLRVLQREIHSLSPQSPAPRLEQAEALLGRLLSVLSKGGHLAETLGGALIRCDVPGDLTIAREPPRRLQLDEKIRSPSAVQSGVDGKETDASLGKDPSEA